MPWLAPGGSVSVSALGGLELRQHLPSDLFQHNSRVPSPVLQVEDDVVDACPAQRVEEAVQHIASTAEAEMDRLRRTVRVLCQIDVERLGEGLEDAGRDGSGDGVPACGDLHLPLERTW